MEWSEATLERNFELLKQDLSSSMRLCRTSFDQYNRVMFTISELLYNGLSNMQDGTAFKSALAVEAAYGIMAGCTPATNQYEIVLLKFARAFIPFMEYFGAHKLTKNEEGPSSSSKRATQTKPEKKKITKKANAKTVTRNNLNINEIAIYPPERTTSKPSLSTKFKKAISSPSNVTGRNTLNQHCTEASNNGSDPTTPLIETKYEDAMDMSMIGETSTTRTDNADDWIKKEEEDYDEGANLPSCSNNDHPNLKRLYEDSREIKEEERLIKEEPIEQPLADKVIIHSSTGTFALQVRRKAPAPITQQPLSTRESLELSQAPNSCIYCYLRMPKPKMENHVKIYHKDKWLKFVKKCSVEGCDFRSAFLPTIQHHTHTCHNEKFESWKKSRRFELPVCTKCPYCTNHLSNLSQFIRHMEFYHPRLCTYEVPILKCATCDFVSSRTFEMFAHWHENTQCSKGLRFVYDTAIRVVHADLSRKRLEIEPGLIPQRAPQLPKQSQPMPQLAPAQLP